MTSALAMIVGVAAATYFWRAAGALAAGKISAESSLFRLASCVSLAMVAALIVRMILYPTGATAESPMLFRLLAAASGLAVFAISKRNVAAGSWTSVAVIIFLNSLSEE